MTKHAERAPSDEESRLLDLQELLQAALQTELNLQKDLTSEQDMDASIDQEGAIRNQLTEVQKRLAHLANPTKVQEGEPVRSAEEFAKRVENVLRLGKKDGGAGFSVELPPRIQARLDAAEHVRTSSPDAHADQKEKHKKSLAEAAMELNGELTNLLRNRVLSGSFGAWMKKAVRWAKKEAQTHSSDTTLLKKTLEGWIFSLNKYQPGQIDTRHSTHHDPVDDARMKFIQLLNGASSADEKSIDLYRQPYKHQIGEVFGLRAKNRDAARGTWGVKSATRRGSAGKV